MKLILTKDFDHFTDRPAITPEKDNISGQAIGNAKGEEWKVLRAIMSPTFSSGQVKRMFSLMCQNADTLVTSCLHQTSKNPALDMMDMFGRFTMDTIASCAFGIDCSSFVREKSEFVQMAETVFSTSFSGLVKMFIRMSLPRLARALGISRDGPDVDFFKVVVEETMRARQESGQCRGDFLDHMLETRHQHNTHTTEKAKTVLSNEVVLAQCVTLLSVGFGTVSSTLYFVSHLLAQHPDHQQRLRQELEALVEEEGQLTYRGIMEAKFLQACVNEALRLYPPVMATARICTKPYQIPGTRIRLRVGDEVMYNIRAVQRDPRFWQNPDQFQPDRFLPHNNNNNNNNKHPITPYSFLPFSTGPRNCIAMRFAQMKVKVALSKLLLKSELKLSPGHENIKMKNWSLFAAPLVDGAPNMSSNMSGESGRSSRPCVGQQVRPEPVVEKTFVESVTGFINEVAPQTYSNPSHYEGKETIIWVKFDYCDINDLARFRDKIEVNGNSPPLLLIVGYTCGVQAWVIPVNGEAMEVLSWRQGAVRTLKILPSPSTSATTVDHYSLKRPIIALCDTAGPGPHFCSVSFISLKTGEQVKIIKFKHPVHDIEANKNVVVIIFSEKLAIFDAATLEDTFTVTTCYPCPGPSVNPIALGDRWLAYADRRLVPLHQSCAGMVPEGTTSYKAKVFDAAKSLTKGLKELSESVASNLMGQRGGSSSTTTTTTTQQSPPTTTTNIPTPGIVTIIDTQGVEGGELNLSSSSSSDSGIVAHFCSHQGAPVVALAFDPTGMLLLTADKLGHNFHLFRLQPHPLSSAQSAVHHLYTLHRGDTTAKVTDISFSLDSRWVAVSTHRGTTHVFPITPYGGNIGVRTHTSTCVVNRLSRFHRSAGLDDTPSSGRNSPVLSASPGSSKFGFEVSPTLAYPNPRYPPYPSPTVVRPLVQLRQPILHSLLGTMGTGPSPSRSPPSGKSPRSPSGDDIIKVASVFGSARGWVAGSPTVARDKQRRTMDSLFVMAYHGNLLEYQLEPSPAPSLPQEKITEDSPIQLQVHASAQWSLVRESTSSELRPPLDLTSPLLAPLSPTRPPSLSPAHSLDHDDPEERWMAQVEIHTHAGPHRRLWMGPQFSFKTIPGVTYSTTGGGGCGGGGGGGGGYYDTSAISAASPLDHPPPRSSPVNMPGSGGANVLIEAGSLTGSHDQSPRLLERNSGDSDSFDPETMMTQLRHDLADAMMDSQHPATHTHTGGGGGCRGWPGAPSRECGLDMTDVMDISCDPPGPSHHHVGDDEIQAVTQVPVTPPSTSARASPHTPSLDDTPPRVLTSSTEELSTTLCPGARHTTNTNTNVSDSVWVPIERPTQHNKSSSVFSPEFVELDRPSSQRHTNTHTQRLSPKLCQSSTERLMPSSGRRTHDATTYTRQHTPSTATTTTAAACVVITSSSTHNNNKSECMIELGSSLGSDSEEKGDSKYKKEQDRDDNNEGDDRMTGNVWRKCVVSSEIPQMYPSLVSKSAVTSASDHESSESHGRLVSSRSKAKQPPSTTGSEDDLWTTTATSDGRKDKRKKKKKNRTSMSQQQGDEEEECESKQQQQQSQQVVDITTTLTTTTSSNNTPNTQLSSSSSLSSQQHPNTDTQHFSTIPLSTTTHTQRSSSSLSTQSMHTTDDNICISNYYERPSQKSDLLSHKSDLLSHKSDPLSHKADPLSHKAEPQQLEMDVDVDYFHTAEEYQEPPPLEERVEELDDLQHQECFLEPQVEELDFEEAREMVVQTLEDFELHPEEEDEEGEREKKKVETLDEDTSVSGDAMLRSLHDDNDLARALEEAYSSDDNAPTRPLPRPRPRTHSRTRTQSRTRTSEMFPFKDDTSEDEGQSKQQQQKHKGGGVGEVWGSGGGGGGGGGVRRRGVGGGTGDETSETSGDDRGESSTDDRRTTTSESDVGASPNPRTTSANKAKKKKKKKR
ncbi:hypothetical protein Pmani_024333 [Petrolisthes manimaculis]|uniref:BCAS3 WD40 domain-containing protein n=1 Tax=Petrolisthes manimaculis TaxID=1843537 RepID=A0AAE1TYT3_9EUCA|nr:hypothetical protein Pmani_024333 [Petrolisthes manimaculis]